MEDTWTWPRYQKMQTHWIEWGPPPYIPIAGYFKLGKARKGSGRGRGGLPEGIRPDTPGLDRVAPFAEDRKGSVKELFDLFQSGAFNG